MKLVAKSGVFLSSAQRTNGTLGQFTIQMPYDYKFDPKQIFKIWISQVNMRNTFEYITNMNRRVYFYIGSTGEVQPNPPAVNAEGRWRHVDLSLGSPTSREICAQINAAIGRTDFAGAPAVQVAYRYGRLHVWSNSTTVYEVYFWFMPTLNAFGNLQPDMYGPATRACGFPTTNVYTPGLNGAAYHLTARPAAEGVRASPAGADFNVADDTISVQTMDSDHYNNIVIKTDLPNENYSVSRDGPSQNGITCNIPICVPIGGQILWQDTDGTYSLLERGRSVVNSLTVTVEDKFGKQLQPAHDWSFVIVIETYEDTEQEKLELLMAANKDDDQVIQLLKMLLLQKEFKGK